MKNSPFPRHAAERRPPEGRRFLLKSRNFSFRLSFCRAGKCKKEKNGGKTRKILFSLSPGKGGKRVEGEETQESMKNSPFFCHRASCGDEGRRRMCEKRRMFSWYTIGRLRLHSEYTRMGASCRILQQNAPIFNPGKDCSQFFVPYQATPSRRQPWVPSQLCSAREVV